MSNVEINWQKCVACQPCLAQRVCKTRAIVKFDADELAFIEPQRCRGCAQCVPACPYAAIQIQHLNRPAGADPAV